jgi:hypothetical protein
MAFRSDSSVVYEGVYIDDLFIGEPCQLPVMIPASVPGDAMVNAAYGHDVDGAGGTGSGTFSIVGGTNIGWLGMDPATGIFSGIPGVGDAGPVTVTVRYTDVCDIGNFAEETYDFTVQDAIWSDDIEAACPGNWALGGDWQCGMPMSGPNAATSGVQVLGTQLTGNYTNNQAWNTATATTGPIDLTTANAPTLRFSTWSIVEGSTYDGFNVKVSTNGVNYTVLPSVVPAYNLTVNGESAWGATSGFDAWQVFSADLSAFAGQNLYIQFGFRSDSSISYAGVYIDDVIIID